MTLSKSDAPGIASGGTSLPFEKALIYSLSYQGVLIVQHTVTERLLQP